MQLPPAVTPGAVTQVVSRLELLQIVLLPHSPAPLVIGGVGGGSGGGLSFR